MQTGYRPYSIASGKLILQWPWSVRGQRGVVSVGGDGGAPEGETAAAIRLCGADRAISQLSAGGGGGAVNQLIYK